jgi:hypothetical protein
VPDARRRGRARRGLRKVLGSSSLWALFAVACTAGAVTHLSVGCNGWDPRDPFQHRSPVVEKALQQMDAGDFVSAEQALTDYLGTGACDKGKIGIPDTVKQKPDGTFDLGLILFYLGEKYGRVFGDEEKGDPDKENLDDARKRSDEIDCAELVLGSIAADEKVPVELRARAAYLMGNLEFMRREYEAAVRYYDQALRLVPGIVEEAGGDGIGRDAAWNRAIALRRIEDKKDAGQDGGDDAADGDDGSDANDAADAQPDGADGADGNSGPDASDGNDGQDGGDAGNDAGGDAGDAGQDAGPDGGGQNQQDQPDAGEPDGGKDNPDDQRPQAPREGPAQPDDAREEEQQQQDRLLDKFEGTPTYQQQEAKRRGGRRTMEDK